MRESTLMRMPFHSFSVRWVLLSVVVFSTGLLLGCGGQDDAAPDSGEAATSSDTPAGSDLTAWELENGIGPITEPVSLGEIDPTLVAEGKGIFDLKCSACHKLDDRYVAPPLRDVTSRRTPEFVLNMMLNPLEMTQRHPATKDLLAEYFVPMTPQGLTEEDALAVLEYLRNAFAEGPSGN
jgi:cytochrome c